MAADQLSCGIISLTERLCVLMQPGLVERERRKCLGVEHYLFWEAACLLRRNVISRAVYVSPRGSIATSPFQLLLFSEANMNSKMSQQT